MLSFDDEAVRSNEMIENVMPQAFSIFTEKSALKCEEILSAVHCGSAPCERQANFDL